MCAKMLSYDERVRITDAFERGHNAEEVADVFGISSREVYLLEEKKKAGDLKPKTHLRGRKPKLTEEQLAAVRRMLDEKPDITLKDLIKALRLPISESRLCRIIQKAGYRLKRKVIHASEQKRPRRPEETAAVGGDEEKAVQ